VECLCHTGTCFLYKNVGVDVDVSVDALMFC